MRSWLLPVQKMHLTQALNLFNSLLVLQEQQELFLLLYHCQSCSVYISHDMPRTLQMGISWSKALVHAQYLLCGLWRELPNVTALHPSSWELCSQPFTFECVHQHQASIYYAPCICNSGGQLSIVHSSLGGILDAQSSEGTLKDGDGDGEGTVAANSQWCLTIFCPPFSFPSNITRLWSRF